MLKRMFYSMLGVIAIVSPSAMAFDCWVLYPEASSVYYYETCDETGSNCTDLMQQCGQEDHPNGITNSVDEALGRPGKSAVGPNELVLCGHYKKCFCEPDNDPDAVDEYKCVLWSSTYTIMSPSNTIYGVNCTW